MININKKYQYQKRLFYSVKYLFICFTTFLYFFCINTFAQNPSKDVNVFLGTSGDHGQLSPAASYPFRMLSIGPQTYPTTHPGYEYYAKEFLGFTHNRMEGVGCQGDGGNILITPFQGEWQKNNHLIKTKQSGSPGYYAVSFKNGINAEFTVNKNQGLHHYTFKSDQNGIYVDLSHAFVGGFIEEQHELSENGVKGFVQSKTTCGRGIYKIFYDLQSNFPVTWQKVGAHQFLAQFPKGVKEVVLKIAFSSVDQSHAKNAITNESFSNLRKDTERAWDNSLNHIQVKGNTKRKKLFYSLLYRSLQSPFVISEEDGQYRNIDGTLDESQNTYYNGWAIWDNYKTQLPLLSFAYQQEYKNIIWSLAEMYKHGKKDFSTPFEPSQTVRTEHSIVVLLDAYRKGYKVSFNEIIDSLVIENQKLDFNTPDKALESSYDTWALAEIFDALGEKEEAKKYRSKALEYKKYWQKDFADMTRNDVDRMSARNMYQGTIWQYRWLVPYDIKGLINLGGGEDKFINELDTFFNGDFYNHANETDIQAPWLYQATKEPWKSQALIHKIAIDTMTQFYFNGNSRGIDPYVGRIYQNKPKAFLRTMDDDAGAMSSWFVLAAAAISPANIGHPIYYLNVPLFREITLNKDTKTPFEIKVENFDEENIFIDKILLNGKRIDRNWITQEEIIKGGNLIIKSTDQPKININYKPWVSEIESQ